MKIYHELYKPDITGIPSVDNLISEVSEDWELKAEKLQARRWEALKNAQRKGARHAVGKI